VVLSQLQVFTSSEAFSVASQECSRVRNANSSRSIFLRETDGVRLLLLIQRIHRAGKIPLLKMLFELQRIIALRKRGSNLKLIIGGALGVVMDSGKTHQMASDVATSIKSAHYITTFSKLGRTNSRARKLMVSIFWSTMEDMGLE
jgi:hypothetical protein